MKSIRMQNVIAAALAAVCTAIFPASIHAQTSQPMKDTSVIDPASLKDLAPTGKLRAGSASACNVKLKSSAALVKSRLTP